MIKIIWVAIAFIVTLFGGFHTANAEVSEADKQTATFLTMIADGRLQEVKAKLPDLMVERPNDPGVQLLLGVVIDDAFKALDIYKKITDTYPESEWADDAYWRIVQFYAVMGDTTQAQSELNNFRRRYPTSGYLVPAIDVVRSSVAMTRAQIKPVVEGPLMTPPINVAETLKPLPSTKSAVDKALLLEKQKNIKSALSSADSQEKKQNSLELQIPADQKNKTNDVSVAKAKQDVGDKTEELGSAEEEVPGLVLLASNDDKPVLKETLPEKPKSGYYGLQVAAFENENNALESKAKFIQQRMRTEVITRADGERTTYAVVIGNYSSRSSAEAAKIIVGRQCECEPIIVEK